MDEVVVDPAITIKAIGHQWYWSAPLHEGDLSATKCLKHARNGELIESDIREIDAQPAMSDNSTEVVNLAAP
ncbi:Cytochrome c oxidase subunit 2 mitochondrial [Bienertia sinuspersici]